MAEFHSQNIRASVQALLRQGMAVSITTADTLVEATLQAAALLAEATAGQQAVLLGALQDILAALETGDSKMRLVHFLDGTKDLWVNPASVTSIEEFGTKTKIHISMTEIYTVDDNHATVADKLVNG